MRRLLRNTKTGEYFLNGKWTRNIEEAPGFQSTGEAIDAVIQHRLADVELVLQFGPEPSDLYDCHFPLQSSSCELITNGMAEAAPLS